MVGIYAVCFMQMQTDMRDIIINGFGLAYSEAYPTVLTSTTREARSVTFNFAEPEGPLTMMEKAEASATVPLMLRLVNTSVSKLFREPAGTLQRHIAISCLLVFKTANPKTILCQESKPVVNKASGMKHLGKAGNLGQILVTSRFLVNAAVLRSEVPT